MAKLTLFLHNKQQYLNIHVILLLTIRVYSEVINSRDTVFIKIIRKVLIRLCYLIFYMKISILILSMQFGYLHEKFVILAYVYVYTSHDWAHASHQNERALAVLSRQAQDGLGILNTLLKFFSGRRFLHHVLHHLKANSTF